MGKVVGATCADSSEKGEFFLDGGKSPNLSARGSLLRESLPRETGANVCYACQIRIDCPTSCCSRAPARLGGEALLHMLFKIVCLLLFVLCLCLLLVHGHLRAHRRETGEAPRRARFTHWEFAQRRIPGSRNSRDSPSLSGGNRSPLK